MVKEQFAAARKLIDKKQYKQARAILEQIDHPATIQWLERLDKIEAAKPKRPPILYVGLLVIAIITALGVYSLVSVLLEQNQRYAATRPIAVGIVDKWCKQYDVSLSACRQAVDTALDADGSRAAWIIFCDEQPPSTRTIKPFVECLAKERVYLPDK